MLLKFGLEDVSLFSGHFAYLVSDAFFLLTSLALRGQPRLSNSRFLGDRPLIVSSGTVYKWLGGSKREAGNLVRRQEQKPQ